MINHQGQKHTGADVVERRSSILIVVENHPVPYDRRVWQEATTLQQAGFDVSVICPAAREFTRRYEVLEDVAVHRYPMLIEGQGAIGLIGEYLWSFFWIFLKTLSVAVMGRGFQVVQFCNPPDIYWPISLFWRLFGRRTVFDHHDLSVEMYAAKFKREGGFFYNILAMMERLTFKCADRVISTNESYRTVAIERGGKSPDHVIVVRNAPDTSRFEVLADPPDHWRRGARHLITFLGEIGEQDGVDVLIRTLADFKERFGPNFVHCVLMGGGPHEQAIRDYAAELAIDEMVTFTGRVGDQTINEVLSGADLGVDPNPFSEYSDKSTATKIMEYMFFSLPIVTFDLTETRRSAGDAAVFVANDDETAFAAAIIDLLSDQERRRMLGDAGRQRVETLLSWEHSATALIGMMGQLTRTGAEQPGELPASTS